MESGIVGAPRKVLCNLTICAVQSHVVFFFLFFFPKPRTRCQAFHCVGLHSAAAL